jgi:hypothetical protein
MPKFDVAPVLAMQQVLAARRAAYKDRDVAKSHQYRPARDNNSTTTEKGTEKMLECRMQQTRLRSSSPLLSSVREEQKKGRF